VTEVLLFLVLVALGISLRRAFVRLDELQRTTESLHDRIAQLKREPSLPPEPIRAPEPIRPTEAVLPGQSVLPPKGGSHEIDMETGGRQEGSISESRGFRLQAEEAAQATNLPPDRLRQGYGESAEALRAKAEGGSHMNQREGNRRDAAEPESLESQIGTQWLLYIGVIAIVIGVAYFEKLAIDNKWLGETARIIQGAVLGLALTYAGVRFARAGYAVYGQMISGGGAAILYLSTYAAFNFYHLIDRPVAFGLMIGITLMVAWLADRQRSQGLALFAAGGGFGTPFLLPGNADAQIALFGYVAILIGGAVLLSRRRDWPALNVVSYLFTLLILAGWVDRFYTREKFLTTELFITLFCAMFLYILRGCRRSSRAGAEISAIVLATAPLAYYVASLGNLYYHPTALLIWLVCLALAGAVVSSRMGTGLGLTIWAGVAVPLVAWSLDYAGRPGWLVPGLTTVAAVYGIALAAQLQASLERDEFGPSAVAWLHLNGLLMFAGAHFLISAGHLAVTGAVAAGFAVWQWGLAGLLLTRRRDQAIHFAALGFTLLAIAIALQFDGPAITVGWAVEGAVIIWLGVKERRDWLRVAGVVLFAVAMGRTFSLLMSDRAASGAVLFNPHAAAAATIVALSYLLAWLHYRDAQAPDRDLGIGAGLITAQVMTLALLTSEIDAYWVLREAHVARELMVSATWGVYATVLIVIGLRRNYAPIRYVAMVVFAVTIVKVFAVDMAELDRIYRVSSVIGLGVLLLLTSYLYQRTRPRL
jgi:uncharacterized membrane protein